MSYIKRLGRWALHRGPASLLCTAGSLGLAALLLAGHTPGQPPLGQSAWILVVGLALAGRPAVPFHLSRFLGCLLAYAGVVTGEALNAGASGPLPGRLVAELLGLPAGSAAATLALAAAGLGIGLPLWGGRNWPDLLEKWGELIEGAGLALWRRLHPRPPAPEPADQGRPAMPAPQPWPEEPAPALPGEASPDIPSAAAPALAAAAAASGETIDLSWMMANLEKRYGREGGDARGPDLPAGRPAEPPASAQVAADRAWIEENLKRRYRHRSARSAPPATGKGAETPPQMMDEEEIRQRLKKIHGGRIPGDSRRQPPPLPTVLIHPLPPAIAPAPPASAPMPARPLAVSGAAPANTGPNAVVRPGQAVIAGGRGPVGRPPEPSAEPVRAALPPADAGSTALRVAPDTPDTSLSGQDPLPPPWLEEAWAAPSAEFEGALPTPAREFAPAAVEEHIPAMASLPEEPGGLPLPESEGQASPPPRPAAEPAWKRFPAPAASLGEPAESDTGGEDLPVPPVPPIPEPSLPAETATADDAIPFAPAPSLPEAEEYPPAPSPWENYAPPLALLQPPGSSHEPINPEDLARQGRLIQEKLAEFKVNVLVQDACAGPVITRYEVEPAVGVRGSQVVNLVKDLARALGVTSIRVVETIPGKTCMGMELPNPRRQMIRLSEVLASAAFQGHPSKLAMALGKDIIGNPVVADLAKAPHMLVAGTTGSGKSVGVNAMILSLLYRATPAEVRFVMIDPKMLELSVYDGIPHLLAPVVTDMKLAANALNWCVGEMERRYRLMSALGVRNLAGYNQKVVQARENGRPLWDPFPLVPESPTPLAPLPFIVVVVDEFADLMMVAGKKIEELIARLAQKARAAGIHLVLATQRPSVDVITGLIKANIPTRIAFQVSSKIDSRTILDQMGAESLLGQGDMLYLPPGTGYPQRVHGAFVADEEVHALAEHLKQFGEPDYVDAVLGGAGEEEAAEAEGTTEELDPLYDQAVAIVIDSRRASISLIQRHLRIGYNRAARLVEQMEVAGVVSPMESNGSRTVLVPSA